MGDCVPGGHYDEGRATTTDLGSISTESNNHRRALEYGNSKVVRSVRCLLTLMISAEAVEWGLDVALLADMW